MTAGQIYFILFLIVASDALTWHVHTAFDEAAKEGAVEHAAIATEKAQESTNALVGTSDAKLDHFTSVVDNLKEHYNVKTIINCTLPANSLQYLRSTADAARSAAR